MIRRRILRLGPALLGLALAACRPTAPAAPPPAPAPAAAPQRPGELALAEVPDFVKVAPVELTTEAGVTAATGKVTFDEERVSRVSSPVSGRVVELLAHPANGQT